MGKRKRMVNSTGGSAMRSGAAPEQTGAAAKEHHSDPVGGERYWQLFEAMQEAFFAAEVVIDKAGHPVDFRFLEANPAFERLTALKRSEVIGRTVTESLPGVEQYWIEALGRVALTGKPTRLEQFSSPLAKWYEAYAYCPRPGQFACTFVDITERKRREREFEEIRTMLMDAERVAHLGSWKWIAETGETVWSEEEFRIYGLEPAHRPPNYQELMSKHFHPEDAATLDRVFKEAVRTRSIFENDHRIVLPDGTVRFIHNRAHPQLDEQGKLISYVGATLDITERRRTEEALRESEERFRVAQELSPDGFTILRPVRDEGGRIVDFTWVYENATIARLNGTDPKEVTGRRLSEFLPSHAASKFHEVYCRVAETGRAEVLEDRYAADDVPRPTWFRVAVVSMGLDIAVLAQDITRQKEFEAELQRLVDERTAKLQELVGELEHFSYTITHDLKAPLRAMKGYGEVVSEMLQESGMAEGKEFLRRIMLSADRMDALIRDALNYSQAVRQELPLEDVDTGELLRGMMDTYPELQRWKAHIQLEGPMPVVIGNEAGLTQCFSNLLGNALKFVKPGQTPEIRIWAALPPDGHQGGWTRIWVEDKGIGISEPMLPRVFDMFSRGSKSYEGTGIGLALVRKVVQRMGGRTGVESREGQWTRFWLEMKTGEVKPGRGPAILSGAASSAGTVLYVEDEESDAIFMERAFASKGMGPALRVVGDGRAAIEYLSGSGEYADRKQYPLPAVVLLDLNLPQVPGFEVLRWMRNHPEFARTPVVVFSSSTREDDRVRARDLQASDFVTKPKSGMEFGNVVDWLRDKWLLTSGIGRKGH